MLVGKSIPTSFKKAQATLKLSPLIYESEKEASKFILLYRASSEHRQDVAPLFIGDRLADDSWPILGMKHCAIGMSGLDIHTYDEVINDPPLMYNVIFLFTYVAFVLISHQAKHKLPTLPSGGFIGREVMVYGVIQLLLERRLVTLYGERGIGKSSVAAAVCRMLLDRVEMTEFTEGIIYFDASSAIEGYPSFHDGLKVQ